MTPTPTDRIIEIFEHYEETQFDRSIAELTELTIAHFDGIIDAAAVAAALAVRETDLAAHLRGVLARLPGRTE